MTEDVCLERNAIFLEIISRETGHFSRETRVTRLVSRKMRVISRETRRVSREASVARLVSRGVSRETTHVYRETACHREMTTRSTSKGQFTLLCRLSTFSAGLKLVRLFLVRNKLNSCHFVALLFSNNRT